MDGQAVQRFCQDHVCGAAQVGEPRKRFLGDHDKFLIEYDCFGCAPRQAPGRDGLAFP